MFQAPWLCVQENPIGSYMLLVGYQDRQKKNGLGIMGETDPAQTVFGIRRMKVSLLELGRTSVRKKPWISLTISSPNVHQLEWKKLVENPSGP